MKKIKQLYFYDKNTAQHVEATVQATLSTEVSMKINFSEGYPVHWSYFSKKIVVSDE